MLPITKSITYDNPPKATIDFETRSACSIKDCGSWRYSLDPTTEILCLVYRLPHWPEGETALWHPAFPHLGVLEAPTASLTPLFNWIAEGGLVEAHNAWFERGIWTNICGPRLHWPLVPHEQWRCSAAKAASYSLPRALENAVIALGLSQQKDMEGSKIMKKMAKPRKPKVAEVRAWVKEHGEDVPLPLLWHESLELLERLWAYCRIDVLAEEGLSHRLKDLSNYETEVYLMDQHINQHGFQLDGEGVTKALIIISNIFTELNDELIELTDGSVRKATQRAAMIEWFNNEGLPLTNTQGGTIDGWLKRQDLPPKIFRALELVRALGRSSTAKFVAARNWADPDTWKVHGGLLYHGAGTGRWSGSGLQPHNFPRGNIKDMELAWDCIKQMDIELINMCYGDAMTLFSYGLRGMIVAPPGRKLVVADYSAIEARVLVWLAEDETALDVFRLGMCIYCAMATEIYKRPINKKEHPDERQMGKQAILGLGYQMGATKFQATLAEKYNIFISIEFAQAIVDAYRLKFYRIKNMWWDTEAAAIAAVKSPGQVYRCNKIYWMVKDGFLHCRLPSGRLLSYYGPAVIKRKTPWGAEKDALTYMGVDAMTKKWRRHDTYGGMLVENITQAVARDLMADAMLRAHKEGVYDVILSVHDELIAEADIDKGSVEDFEALMAQLPAWAEGCPVAAEGWTGFRYKK